jgi:crotonobetainyl-CoA:carnitine CoA-transferase CaiB-like acyl-CoA transferase
MLYLNGYSEDPPNHPAGNLAYKQVSLAAALGAVSLILERASPGAGGRITVSMQEAMMWTTIQSANENYWHWHQARQGRHGLGNLGGQTVFEAADGQWVSFYQHPPAWGAYVAWVGEALGETRFSNPAWDDGFYRFQNNDQVTEVTVRLCQTLARDDLIREGQRRGVLVVPVQGASDIARDPHLRERGFFQRVWYDQLEATLETIRAPFISSAYRAEAHRAPALGQHSREVLAGRAGLSEPDIERLVASGLVGCPAEGVEA